MSKRYKLLKDLPGYQAGTIFSEDSAGAFIEEGEGNSWIYAAELLKAFTDPDCSLDMTEWFEPIEPEQPQWEILETDRDHITIKLSDESLHASEAIREAVEATLKCTYSKYVCNYGDITEPIFAAREALQKEREGL